jgi:hypothetical protein
MNPSQLQRCSFLNPNSLAGYKLFLAATGSGFACRVCHGLNASVKIIGSLGLYPVALWPLRIGDVLALLACSSPDLLVLFDKASKAAGRMSDHSLDIS